MQVWRLTEFIPDLGICIQNFLLDTKLSILFSEFFSGFDVLEKSIIETAPFETIIQEIVTTHESKKVLLVTTRKMRVGPSESTCRSRLQTTFSCCGKEPWW
jgi:hypothetical protein